MSVIIVHPFQQRTGNRPCKAIAIFPLEDCLVTVLSGTVMVNNTTLFRVQTVL